MAKIIDNRVHSVSKVTYKIGDVLRGVSGTFYMLIKQGGKYNLLNLEIGSALSYDGKEKIDDIVNFLDRDAKGTHIKSDKVSITFE